MIARSRDDVVREPKGKETGMLRWVVAASVMVLLPSVASAQDAEAGKKVFAKCAPCHSIGPGAKNKVGPEQNGLVGRKAGSVEGFNYSEAMKNSGITWDEANLDEYITDPKKKVPGNKMVFPGIKDELQRADLIAYLGSFNADGSSKK
jgi:cytochrome c